VTAPAGRDASGEDLRVVQTDPAAQPGADLLAAMEAELNDLYGRHGWGPVPGFDAQEAQPPHGAFLVIYEGEQAIGCGAVRRLGPALAEIKRMYVVPAARSRGHARRLLIALEDAARDAGFERVRLDTGTDQPHARALYESAGYAAIPDYNGNPYASYWFEKGLAG
jgi:GNAT superfamily N-acetyltransferase